MSIIQSFNIHTLICFSFLNTVSLFAQDPGYQDYRRHVYYNNQREADLPLDWDYKESWRSNREAFFKGETESQAVREELPYGPAGIGYDAAPGYLQIQREAAAAGRSNVLSENEQINQNRTRSGRTQQRIQQNP